MRAALLGALAVSEGLSFVSGRMSSTSSLLPANSITLQYPGNLATDDVLLAVAVDNEGWQRESALGFNWPAGWQTLPGSDYVGIGWRRYAGGSSVTVTISAGASLPVWGAVLAYRGCTTAGVPIDGLANRSRVNYDDAPPGSAQAAPVDVTGPGRRLLNIFFDAGGTSPGTDPARAIPPEFVLDYQDVVAPTGSYRYLFEVWGRSADAGSYAGGIVSSTAAGIGETVVAISLALLPPGATPHT